MIVLEHNRLVFFDVDDTLIKWKDTEGKVYKEAITIIRYLQDLDDKGKEKGKFPIKEEIIPHKKHIRLLKGYKKRGFTVVVWSHGGWEWARDVIKALKLEKYVALVLEKPILTYDDLPPRQILGAPIWIKDEE